MLTPAKSGGWNSEDLLTSDEVNHLQAELLKAIDGEGGGTYELLAALIFSAAGAGVEFANETLFSGAASVTSTLTIEASAELILAASGAATVHGTATFAAGAILALTGGADMTLGNNSTISLASGALLTIADGADITLSGDMTVTGTGDIIVEDNALVTFKDGSGLDIEDGATLNLQGDLTMPATGTVTVASGATVQLARARDLKVASESYLLLIALTPAFGSEGWSREPTSLGARWMMASADGSTLYFPLLAPAGDVITSITASIDGGIDGGHSGTPPTDMPIIELVELDLAGTVDIIARRVDPAVGPAYDDAHDVTINSGAHAVGGHSWPHTCSGAPLYVRVISEGPGGNAQANTTVLRSLAALAQANSARRTGGASEFR
jgi:hypothetical protein